MRIRSTLLSSVVCGSMLAACGAEEEGPGAPRTALGGAPNLRFVGSGAEADAAASGLPTLAPGESYIQVRGLESAVDAVRPTVHFFDGACTNLYGSGDLGEEFADAGDDVGAAADPDASGVSPSAFSSDDVVVYLHLMPPLREQPDEGGVVTHASGEDDSGTFIHLQDQATATTTPLARARIAVGPLDGDGRLVELEGEAPDGTQVSAGFRLVGNGD